MSAPIIGLIGRARSGKDTFAARLVAHHGYTRLAFADALRDMALAVDPIIPGVTHGRSWRLSEVVADIGWEDAKDWYPEVRRMLQNLGVAIRNMDPDFWVSAVRGEIEVAPMRPFVITDVRFRNEADMIREAGGILVRITRPGIAEDDHVSETELAHHWCDVDIANDGTVDDLHWRADDLAGHVRRYAIMREATAV